MGKFTKKIPLYRFLNPEPWCRTDSRQTKTHYLWPLRTILHTGKVTRLVAERPRNFGSIPGRSRILCSPKHPDHHWGPTYLQLYRH